MPEHPLTIGIVSPCSATPQIELAMGVDRLRDAGLKVQVHEQCARQHFWFAGTDEQRAGAFYDFACDPSIDVIWSARGGSGGPRLLPILDQLTRQHGQPPRKLLVGYSDVTSLHHYVRLRWNWSTLHASMPASDFYDISDEHFQAMLALVRRQCVPMPWKDSPLQFLTDTPTESVTGTLVGGNLAVWNYLTGTPWQPRDMAGKLLFFEDLSEGYYRIDAMLTQIEQAGGLDGLAGIVLGEFTACDDDVAQVLKEKPSPDQAKQAWQNKAGQPTIPLRPTYDQLDALTEIFATRGKRNGFPVAYGLPVGHGPVYAPLPLHADYTLTPDGRFELNDWDWLNRS